MTHEDLMIELVDRADVAGFGAQDSAASEDVDRAPRTSLVAERLGLLSGCSPRLVMMTAAWKSGSQVISISASWRLPGRAARGARSSPTRRAPAASSETRRASWRRDDA